MKIRAFFDRCPSCLAAVGAICALLAATGVASGQEATVCSVDPAPYAVGAASAAYTLPDAAIGAASVTVVELDGEAWVVPVHGVLWWHDEGGVPVASEPCP